MSKLDKLNIINIRSFGPGEQIPGNRRKTLGETIHFNTPLTLIVGHNGSGKTTVIECLKYATTGQLPPNSKGGAFIHDPNLTGEKEVLAQVKLQFKDMEANTMTVARSILLTVKKSTKTQKTVDSSLSVKKDGEKTVISSRVSDLDENMIRYLGVSEAILDSVIFCHQDESLWPMSEPLALKKKFDEIFDAGRYTKAIDIIKKSRKDLNIELGKHKLEEDHTKVMKNRAEKCESRSIALQDEIENLRAQLETVEDEMKIAGAHAKKKRKEAEGYYGIISELKTKRSIQQERQKNVDELKPNLKELSDSDEALQAYLAQYQERMAHYEQEQAQYAQQDELLSGKVSEYRKNLSAKLSLQGRFRAERDSYERQLDSRAKLIKDSANKHRIRGYEGDLADYQIREFTTKITKAVHDKKREVTRTEEETREVSRKAEAALKEIEGRMEAQKAEKNSAKRSMAANDKKIQGLQCSMDKVQVDEGRKAVLDSSCQELEARLKTSNSDFEKAQWKSNLDQERGREKDVDAEIQKLTAEQKSINRLSAQRGKLDQVTNDLKKREKSLEAMIATYGNRITPAIGANWKPETVEDEFKTVMREKSSIVAEARSLRDGTAAELSHCNDKCKMLRDELDRKIAERDSCEKKVIDSMEDLTSVEDYESLLAELEESRLSLKMDIEGVNHLKSFWSKALKHVEMKNKCHVCEHRFSGDQEKTVALDHIKKRLIDNQQEAWEEELKVIEGSLVLARAVRPRYDTYRRLSKTEIQNARKQLEQAEAKREEAVARLENQDSLVREAEASKTGLEALDKPITNIAYYVKEISGFHKSIKDVSSQSEISSSRSIDEVERLLDGYNDQMRTITNKIETLRAGEQRAIAKKHKLEVELGEAKKDLGEVTHQLENRNGLARQIQELKDSNTILRETIRQADAELDTLSPQADKAKEEMEDVRLTGHKKVQAIRDDHSNLSLTNTNLENITLDIQKYIERGGSDNLTECQQAIETIEGKIREHEQESAQVQKAIADLQKQIDHGAEEKRSITDNLNYRKNLLELEVLNAEIAQLESTNADEDYDRLDSEARAFDDEKQLLNAKKGTLYGQIHAKDEELRRSLEEWDSDYKDAGHNYREAHIKVETTKAAIEDLGKYGNALDQAVMKYHSMKMEEINRIAGELWTATYRGTDVDSILIRSDHENSKGSSRNYNYRVCMIKRDTEMDMRGRCSAGQRVLASIIIRLALAECFGVNCGIIALDEPTTNLDQDNIRSLAESLHDIIRVRQAQKNFQLIVITHDEEFLKAMRCDDFCDNYWRIGRNDIQESIIRMQSIHEVLG